MRLLSCHIENFGKLHDFSLNFSEGANILCEENGWGKSTLAAFIRAMFYGLEGERKRSIQDNERKRYKPWQGGVFGGQLVFEIQGRQYRISRIFRDKEQNDEFELRDVVTNLISADYSKKIGEEIFKINRESFLRTVFIDQNACATAATDDINAKIGNRTDNAKDLSCFEAANARLTEMLNRLTPSRITGSLAKRKDEIARYERMVQDGQGIGDSIESYQELLTRKQAEYDAFKEKQQRIGEQQTQVSKMQAALGKKSEWERLKKTEFIKGEKKKALRAEIPGEVPSLEEIKKEISACGEMEKARERISLYGMTETEKQEYSDLCSMFSEGVFEDEELEQKRAKASRFRELQQQLAAERMSETERQQLGQLEVRFGKEEESVSAIAGRWNDRNTRKAALPSKRAALMALKASLQAGQQRQKKGSTLLVVGILLVAIGILLAVLAAVTSIGGWMLPAGILFLVAGAAAILAGARARSGSETKPMVSPELEQMEKSMEEDEIFIWETDRQVEDYLKQHQKVFEENTVAVHLQEITADSILYQSLRKKADQEKESTVERTMEALRDDLHNFFRSYQMETSDTDFFDDLYRLQNKKIRYHSLQEKDAHDRKNRETCMRGQEEIREFLSGYRYEPEESMSAQLQRIREQVDAYLDASRQWEEAYRELEQFEKEHDMALLAEEWQGEELPSLEGLNLQSLKLTEEMENTQQVISSYQKTLNDLWEQQEEWEDARIYLEELKVLQKEEQEKYRHITMARLKLVLAKEAMIARYADPILKSFTRYYEMIAGTEAEAYHLDANTTVTVDVLGKQREVGALSTGYQDLIGICLRMSLIDAMYPEERPMLIMDDPFINLDDQKLAAAKIFLGELAQNYQIIYCTCNRGRFFCHQERPLA